MNIGSVSTSAPAQAAAGALTRALDLQGSMAVSLLNSGTGQSEARTSAMAEQGVGQKLNMVV